MCPRKILAHFYSKFGHTSAGKSGLWRVARTFLEVPVTVGAAPQLDVDPALQEPVYDRLCRISVMQHLSPCRQRLIDGDEDRLPT